MKLAGKEMRWDYFRGPEEATPYRKTRRDHAARGDTKSKFIQLQLMYAIQLRF